MDVKRLVREISASMNVRLSSSARIADNLSAGERNAHDAKSTAAPT
jgi:hypothetical protein